MTFHGLVVFFLIFLLTGCAAFNDFVSNDDLTNKLEHGIWHESLPSVCDTTTTTVGNSSKQYFLLKRDGSRWKAYIPTANKVFTNNCTTTIDITTPKSTFISAAQANGFAYDYQTLFSINTSNYGGFKMTGIGNISNYGLYNYANGRLDIRFFNILGVGTILRSYDYFRKN